MKMRITLGVATLAFALASVPAFAQQHIGRGLNDGGVVDVTAAPAASKTLYNSTAPVTPHVGRGLNDGGQVESPSSAQMAGAGRVQWAQNPPHVGRNLNDGGF
jgi:hypothetical protein